MYIQHHVIMYMHQCVDDGDIFSEPWEVIMQSVMRNGWKSLLYYYSTNVCLTILQ